MTQARVMLALIGPGWTLHDDPDKVDWVRKELLSAVQSGKPILPVLVGDAETLASSLSKLPAAFTRQAVRVSEDMAGFDLYAIVKGLRDLGAFTNDNHVGLAELRSFVAPSIASGSTLTALNEGKSVLVAGSSGSGRSAFLRHVADTRREKGGFVTTHGVYRAARSRRTHAVIASWVDGLCCAIQNLDSEEERTKLGSSLVRAVIDRGPDLLSRRVVRPSSLLEVGNDRDDQKVLDAARRPVDRWAPFPPARLVSQSRGVLEQFAEQSNRMLLLIIDDIDEVDGSSLALVRSLLSKPLQSARSDSSTPACLSQLVLSAMTPVGTHIEQMNIRGLATTHLEPLHRVSLNDTSASSDRNQIVEHWLKNHRVRIDETVSGFLETLNPYYSVALLWYLVEHGLINETAPESKDVIVGGAIADDEVLWTTTSPDELLVVPSNDQLLDHIVQEHIPVRFRPILEAGSLIGRRFSFSAAYATAYPPDANDDETPSARSIDRWQKLADDTWEQLSEIDPDGVVVDCHLSYDSERVVVLAQADLPRLFRSALSRNDERIYHQRLANYFSQPLANDTAFSSDDKFVRAESAADHWSQAGDTRGAADAHRRAAQIAEENLAYQDARGHYQLAIRLLTQLIAESDHADTSGVDEHEDLLTLANCLYRLGQMMRLASESKASQTGVERSEEPAQFTDALKWLDELSVKLQDKDSTPTEPSDVRHRTERRIPEPNVVRHHLRLCDALRGFVNLELAEWNSNCCCTKPKPGNARTDRCNHSQRERELLFETLRHAEAARGEAGSSWLLAAASARLAQQLANEAADAILTNEESARSLVAEAHFHIERVLGLRPVSAAEDRDLDAPRARAWLVLGQIFQHVWLQPQLAEWALRRMNLHDKGVSDAIDMVTDHQLGNFLVSHLPHVERATDDEAKRLLNGHRKWAIESSIEDQCVPAFVSLARLELTEVAKTDCGDALETARRHLQSALSHSSPGDSSERAEAQLLVGLVEAFNAGENGLLAHDAPAVEAAFRKAGLHVAPDGESAQVIATGWRQLCLQLLPACPRLLDTLDHALTAATSNEAVPPAGPSSDAQARVFQRARTYVERLDADTRLVPSHDEGIWELLNGRVAAACYSHAEATAHAAEALLEIHRTKFMPECLSPERQDYELRKLRRDVRYAVAAHEWYRSTDPARLLTLAREWNAPISGVEWASPSQLRGRLALMVLENQYDAAKELGAERFGRVTSMVSNRFIGAPEVGPLEQLFYLASQISEPHQEAMATSAPEGRRLGKGWPALMQVPSNDDIDNLGDAYQLALAEHNQAVRGADLPAHDLHLRDKAVESTPAIEQLLDTAVDLKRKRLRAGSAPELVDP